MRLFGRKWRVTVGTLQSEDLDITFKIKRALTPGKPSTCELSVFNLSKDHRNEIRDATRPAVRVEAGYKDGMSLLFQGNERQTVSKRDGGDWETKITAGDGEASIRLARSVRAFGPDTRLEDVVKYCADQMDLGAGNTSEALEGAALDKLTAVFPRGTVLRGRAAQELTALLASANLEWSVQEGVLQVLPRGGSLNREAILLRSDSGLLESPEVGKHGIVKAKALLIPDLVPGRLVKLESDAVNGTYRIETAEYSGQTKGDDWGVEMELRDAS